MTRDPAFTAVAAVCKSNMEVEGHPVTGLGFAPLRGFIGPTIVKGRAPQAPDEVALGATTLAAVHKHMGDTVRISTRGGAVPYRVVGRVVLKN